MSNLETLKSTVCALQVAHKLANDICVQRGAEFDVLRHFPRGLRAAVTAGKKLPRGTVGTIYNVGEGKFGQWALFDRDDTGERVMTSMANLTICDEAYAAAQQRLEESLEECAAAERDFLFARKQYRAAVVAKAGIDLTVRSDAVQHSSGWRDGVTYSTPCAAEASDDDIRAALAIIDPAQSSWGALRWSCGTSLVERLTPTLIRVSHETGLAD